MQFSDLKQGTLFRADGYWIKVAPHRDYNVVCLQTGKFSSIAEHKQCELFKYRFEPTDAPEAPGVCDSCGDTKFLLTVDQSWVALDSGTFHYGLHQPTKWKLVIV